MDEYLLHEESLWKTKSRELWLTSVDLNTKFFHTSTLVRRRRNSIDILQSPNSGWLTERRDIGACFINNFKNLFTTSNPALPTEFMDLFDCFVSENENTLLCAQPTDSEIYDSLLSLGRTKAPGPDGFTTLFYVKYWEHIKSTVLSAVGDFFSHNQLLREQNHTFIALIPKKLGASSVQQFRPISLCNIIYKIISKLLANRLKPLLPKFISPFQTAFVPGRLMQDNSILAHEMLHTLKHKRGRGGLMAINIDMEKAFDKMEWPFLLAILKQLGFHDIWINWIRICISTTSFSVLLNGSSFGHFRPSRGLRQGDPLSPFLFIIGTEALSRLLHNSLRGFKISRSNASLNHLLFADDLVIFTSATSSEASPIKTCLDKYSSWSGQSVNFSKSSIIFSKNTDAATRISIGSFLPFALTPASAKHLGLPILFGRSKHDSFVDILDKVNGKIEGWKSKTLSQAGKSVLIKVVASTILSYAMSSFLLSDKFCHKLDIAFKNFWLGFPKDKARNLTLKSWVSLCQPKDNGGLGFRLMKDINLSLIAKLGWKLLVDHDSLWVSIFKAKYIKYGNLLTCPLSSGSFIWNSIKAIVPLLASGACYLPFMFSQLSVWTSPWIPTVLGFKPEARIPSLSSLYPLSIAELFNPSTSSWNLDILTFLFQPHSVLEIQKIRLRSINDSILWTPSSSGNFSTKSMHHHITISRGVSFSPLSASKRKSLWRLKMHHRLRFFLWKMIWNIIPTKIRISSSIPNSTIDTSCSLCSFRTDSILHLFFSCSIARVVWRNSFWPLDILAIRISSMESWLDLILHPRKIGIPSSDHHLFQIFATVACDQIWLARTKALHDDIVSNALVISSTINCIVKHHHSAWTNKLVPKIVVWERSFPPFYKINYDTAICLEFSAQAAVCRNSQGTIIGCSTVISPHCSPVFCEATAAFLAW
jgi:hypothetical protein